MRFVRAGYLLFRYRVDAEDKYDGLTFSVDWKHVLGLVSKQAEFKEFNISLPAGDGIRHA